MITVSAMSAGVNVVMLALTPTERWQAARDLDSGFIDERWLILIGAIVLAILVVLFVLASYNHIVKERKAADRLFLECADKMGLSRRERQILMDIATAAKLKRTESIFTMVTAFDRGAAAMTERVLAQEGVEASKGLNAELSVLREKLGFQKRHDASTGSATRPNKPSSRQIPTGKKLHVTRRKSGDLANVESTVIENNDTALAVELTVSLESKPGELWCVRYYFGASVWEFESSSVSCNGNILVLKHSDNVRFINRRRFLRVPVNKPTFIARFPFVKTLSNDDSGNEPLGAEHEAAGASGDRWGPPEFVPASVTELAGPGLRIEAPLEVNVGDRVLVILKLNDERDQDASSQRTGKTTHVKMVEDIGEVRHTKAIQNGFSIAVELTGLSDSDVDELIRATNAASLKVGAKTQDVPEPAPVPGV